MANWAAELALLMQVMGGFETNVDPAQTLCLAQNIYHEARQETIEGQTYVAQVTLNRVNSGRFGDTVCDVVYAKKKVKGEYVSQFSWVTDEPTVNLHNPIDKASFELAAELAIMAMHNNSIDPDAVYVSGAMFYYNPAKANPKWADSMWQVAQVGNHVFLVDEE